MNHLDPVLSFGTFITMEYTRREEGQPVALIVNFLFLLDVIREGILFSYVHSFRLYKPLTDRSCSGGASYNGLKLF